MKCPINNFNPCMEKECPFYVHTGCNLAEAAKSINQLEDQLDSLADKLDGVSKAIYEGLR